MSVVLPYMLLAFLGTTFDLRTYQKGYRRVFDDENYTETALNTSNVHATYMILPEDSFPYEYFGIPVDFAVQRRHLHSNGGSDWNMTPLEAVSWRQDSVTLAVKFELRTSERTLIEDGTTQIREQLQDISDDQTHYVRTWNCGKKAILLVRFRCDYEADRRKLRKIFTSYMGESGEVSDKTADDYTKARAEWSSETFLIRNTHYGVHMYSNLVHLGYDFSSPKNWMQLISDIFTYARDICSPLTMELEPLHDLDPKFHVLQKHNGQTNSLKKLDMMLTDVKKTQDELRRWDDYDEKYDEMVEEFYVTVKGSHRALMDILLSGVSLYKTMDKKLFKSTLDLYYAGLQSESDSYFMAFKRLKEYASQCENEFREGSKGILKVSNFEVVQLGIVGGLEQCKTECYARPHCRAIGYSEARKQCDIYSRSSSTSEVLEISFNDNVIYDRRC